jgi:hypothetical protein
MSNDGYIDYMHDITSSAKDVKSLEAFEKDKKTVCYNKSN